MSQNNSHFTAENDSQKSRAENLKALGLAGAATAGAVVVFTSEPAHAQSTTTTSITDMVTDLQSIVTAGVGLGVLALGAFYGFKVLRRSMG